MIDLFAPRGRWNNLPSIADRIDANGDCWLWIGALASSGYGSIGYHGKTVAAHRFVWESLVGPIPKGLQIDHLCRVRNCVNPDHLEVVTGQENTRRGRTGLDARQKQRNTKRKVLAREKQANTPKGDGECRICRRRWQQEWVDEQESDNDPR